MITYYHINDVIATNDTTTQRLELQYKLLSHYFGVNNYQIIFEWSDFGNSAQTGQQCATLIKTLTQDKQKDHHTVICINNASRAKHKDSGNAKGSGCLRAKIKDTNVHVVGVDHEVFVEFSWQIESLAIVEDLHINGVTKHDISQGSQFRSLEFWPSVQVFLQTKSKLPTILSSGKIEHDTKNAYITIQAITTEQLPHSPQVSQSPRQEQVINHHYVPNTHNLQRHQLIGQAKKFRKDRNLVEDQNFLDSLSIDVAHFNEAKNSLSPNQLIIIDRDKFNNTKCLSAHHDGIHGLSKSLAAWLGEKISISRENGNDEWFIVQSISDKTGQKCIRNGSSRWPNNEQLVELNYSVDETKKTRETIAQLPLGTILTLASA